MIKRSKIIGTGSALPPYEIDNDTLMPLIEKEYPEARSREWCEQVFGVFKRRRAVNYEKDEIYEGCYDSDLAVQACQDALKSANLTFNDIDMIIYATASPEFVVDPDPVIVLHKKLGGKTDCGGFTMPITCTGLVDAVIIADSLIKTEKAKNILLVATNTFSAWRRQSWEFMFFAGDAASSLVMTGADENDESGILDTYWEIFQGKRAAYFRFSGTRHLWFKKGKDDEELNGLDAEIYSANVIEEGFPIIEKMLDKIMAKHPQIMEKIDWLVTHQANALLQTAISMKTGVPIEKIPFHIQEVGNTMPASTGLVIDKQVKEGKFKKGDLILVISAGTGWRCASYLMRW